MYDGNKKGSLIGEYIRCTILTVSIASSWATSRCDISPCEPRDSHGNLLSFAKFRSARFFDLYEGHWISRNWVTRLRLPDEADPCHWVGWLVWKVFVEGAWMFEMYSFWLGLDLVVIGGPPKFITLRSQIVSHESTPALWMVCPTFLRTRYDEFVWHVGHLIHVDVNTPSWWRAMFRHTRGEETNNFREATRKRTWVIWQDSDTVRKGIFNESRTIGNGSLEGILQDSQLTRWETYLNQSKLILTVSYQILDHLSGRKQTTFAATRFLWDFLYCSNASNPSFRESSLRLITGCEALGSF